MMRSLAACTALACCFASSAMAKPALDVHVVVVTTFEMGADTGDAAGEFQTWVEKYPLTQTFAAPGTEHGVMRYDPKTHVLGIVSGEGPEHMASAITGLVLDPRFNFKHAYFVLAGIGGVDPKFGTVGSAIWAPHVINGGLAHLIDPREMPSNWPDGFTPTQGNTPFASPVPAPHSQWGDMMYTLDPALVQWAYNLTKSTEIPDTQALQAIRARYTGYPNAQKPPSVGLGDTQASATFWIGSKMNDWAERWVNYWTQGQGTFATTAEEDLAFCQALTLQAKAGRVDPKRMLVLRTASNFDMQYPGQTAADLLTQETQENGYSGFSAAIDSAYRVGSVVVRELTTHWDKYGPETPKL